jgi:activator of HSP90 ATPase
MPYPATSGSGFWYAASMGKDIRQTVTFDAKPAVIYRALVDSKLHSAFTKAPAAIEPVVGGSVSCHGGYISGFNVELVKNVRVVQAWRGKNWPTGAWSIATFALAPVGANKTKLTFTQFGVPDEFVKPIDDGWRARYWKPLAAWLKPTPESKKKASRKKTR